MAEKDSGFLSRWARRKTEVLKGKPLDEPVAAAASVPLPASAPASVTQAGMSQPAPLPGNEPDAETQKKLLSLDDVARLTNDSDFKPFMAQEVGPEVRNAAMKKLFADPHYNVMDGLDIYIDDYSKPDPIPESMLRQMVGAKLMRIFDDDENTQNISDVGAAIQSGSGPLPLDNPNNPMPETVAQSGATLNLRGSDALHAEYPSKAEPSPGVGASQHDHAHSHLRLQPDHAPSDPQAGRGHS